MPKLIGLVPKEFKKSLTEAEKLMLEQAPKGEYGDMRSGDEKFDDPANAKNWPESRHVRAKFLEWLLRDKKARDFIHDKGIMISGIRIDGRLDLFSLTFPSPINIQYSHFADEVDLLFARVKLIDFSNSYFNNCHADGLVIELSAFFNNSRSEGEFRLVGANIGRDLVCNGATFINKKADAFSGDGIATKGNVSLDGIESNGVFRLVGANIGGILDCTGAKFLNKKDESFNGDAITTKGTVFLKGLKSTGIFRLVAADISGNLQCHGAKFMNKNGESFNGDRISNKGDVFLNGIESKGEFRFEGAHIGGNLYCDGASFQNKEKTALQLRQAIVEGRLCLNKVKRVKGKIDLLNTKAGAFVDDDKSWPDEGNLLLNGFEYSSFADNTPTDVKTRLQWLKRQPQKKYLPQPYQQLAKVYREMGRDRDAKKVLLEKERMRQKYGDIGKLAKSWGWFLDRTIGYGYRVDKALRLLVLLILAGTLFFRLGDHFGLLQETKTATTLIKKSAGPVEKFYPEFNSFFYSADAFVPFLDLHQESYWLPDSSSGWGSALRFYFWFHIMAGWVFSTLLLATFTGLIRKE